jgi:hypothetical protein
MSPLAREFLGGSDESTSNKDGLEIRNFDTIGCFASRDGFLLLTMVV